MLCCLLTRAFSIVRAFFFDRNHIKHNVEIKTII